LKFSEVAFTTEHAEGALPNGTRVEKTRSKPGDTHTDGAKATVLGSMGPIEFEGDARVFGYFVTWDELPGVPVFIAGTRVRKLK
jgi:hypothetical protein